MWGVRGATGSYTADIPEYWTFTGRCFGGYSASIALVAAGLASGAEEGRLVSAHVAFARVVEPGPVSLQVESVSAGRTIKWLRCALSQHDEVRLLVTCCLQVGPTSLLSQSTGQPFVPTDTRIDFLAEVFPFLADFDERAVNYPPSRESFGDGDSDVSVLTFAGHEPFSGPGLTEQLWDVAAADLHLLDAACRYNRIDLDKVVSVDLTVNWSGDAAASDGWRLVEAESTRDSKFPVATGTVSGSAGEVRARAMSVGRLLR